MNRVVLILTVALLALLAGTAAAGDCYRTSAVVGYAPPPAQVQVREFVYQPAPPPPVTVRETVYQEQFQAPSYGTCMTATGGCYTPPAAFTGGTSYYGGQAFRQSFNYGHTAFGFSPYPQPAPVQFRRGFGGGYGGPVGVPVPVQTRRGFGGGGGGLGRILALAATGAGAFGGASVGGPVGAIFGGIAGQAVGEAIQGGGGPGFRGRR